MTVSVKRDHVLAGEDYTTIQKPLAMHLALEGYKAEVASNGGKLAWEIL